MFENNKKGLFLLRRASRTDFDELEKTLLRMESECKLAWDYLKVP